MQNILLLTDFSKNANNAINYTMQLFSGDNCRFYVLNVQKVSKYITSDLITSPNKTVYDAVIKNPKKSIDILVNDLRKKYKNEAYDFEGICDYDSFISSVKQVILTKRIDLIVMGTNGISGVKETIFGSNTMQILKVIDLPTLVIPENYKFNKPDKILFIYENEIDEDIIKPLTFIISKFNAYLNILNVLDEETNNEFVQKNDKLIENFNKAKVEYVEVNYNIEKNTIEQVVLMHKIKMISKIINTKSFFKRLFSKSITPNITYANKVPLLFL